MEDSSSRPIPGMVNTCSTMMLSSILASDYPVVLAIVVMLAFLVVLMNFLADVLYQRIDPRIKVR